MESLRRRGIEGAPAQQLRPPGDVGVFAVNKEIGIEEIAVDGHVVDHAAPVQRRRRRRAEDVFQVLIAAAIRLAPAPIEVPQGGRETDAGRIDARLVQRRKTRPDGKQFAAHGARFRVGLAGFHQGANEAGAQQHVGVERQYPFGRTGTDGAVLRFGETQVPAAVDHPHPPAELAQHGRGAIGGPVIHHHDFDRHALLADYRFQTAPDVPRAVIRDDGCTDGWVGH